MLLLFCCLFSISCPWIASFSCGNKINQLRITQRTYNHLRNTGYALQLLNKIQAYCVFRLESRCSNYHHDIMNASEHAFFSDESDCAFVQRRPADSVHPIRVAMLEFDIPDKLPNPTNFLESKVWQRENEIEILRERFTLPRAISLAKSADQKDQRRDFLKAIRDRQKLTVQKPLLIVEVLRQSLHRGGHTLSDTPNRNDEWKQYLSTVATQLTLQVSVVAVGANTENSIFNGCYEDLAILNGATTLPVIYNDFVTSVFQLLQAKIHGAHAVKLLACVLEVKDLNYLIKVAKSLGLCAIIVVASKPQLLSVLSEVIGWQAVSVSSRNMRLWKIDPGKAERILQDEEVRSTLALRRAAVAAEGGDFVLLQEGFASTAEVHASSRNGIDAIILGEELIPYKVGFIQTLKGWMK